MQDQLKKILATSLSLEELSLNPSSSFIVQLKRHVLCEFLTNSPN